jgi:hypothetical protein
MRSPTLVALSELAVDGARPLVLWVARWIDERASWARSVLFEEARAAAARAEARRGAGLPWSPFK